MNRLRHVGQIDFQANQERSIELPMDRPISFIEVLLTVTYTVADASAASFSEWGPASLINQMRHTIQFADRQTEEPKRLTGREWFLHNLFQFDSDPMFNTPGLTAAQHVVRQKLIIPYSQRSPVFSKFPPLAAQQLVHNQLFLRWNAIASLITDSTASTTTLDALTADVWVLEDLTVFEPDRPLPVYYTTKGNYVPTSINQGMRIKAPAGMIHTDVMMITENDGAKVQTLIDWMDILYGGSGIRRSTWYNEFYKLWAYHQFDRRCLMGVAGSEVAFQPRHGVVYWDWDLEGDLDDLIDTRFGDLEFKAQCVIAPTAGSWDVIFGYLRPVEAVESA